ASGGWGAGVSLIGQQGEPGEDGTDGADGEGGAEGGDGGTPVMAVVADGDRRGVQGTDWAGGSGTKPGTGYVGAEGLTETIGDAIDVRGPVGDQGEQGVGIASAEVVEDHLIITLTDETEIDAGAVRGQQGEPGEDGTDGED